MIRLTVVVLALSATLSAQQASLTNYGRGCTLPGLAPPLIRSSTLPKIGQTFEARFIGPNSVTPVSQDQPVLLTGVQQIAVPVPPISALQPAGCQFLVNPLIILPMAPSGSAYQGSFKGVIPNDKSLIGVTLYQQFASIYRNCRGGPCIDQMLRVSDGLKIVIGT